MKHQIAARGITDEKVLAAMRTVPREQFVPPGEAALAYDDGPLPIGAGQTISQPFIVAYMIDALKLKGGERVLEIGTGSGYAAAVLARIAGEVYTVECIGDLAERAQTVLEELDYDNVQVLQGDGTKGWPEYAPYEGIVVTAGGPEVPESLRQQLAVGGRLVIPVGRTRSYQEIEQVTRVSETEYKTEDLLPVRFVPLVGEEGWTTANSSALSRSKTCLS